MSLALKYRPKLFCDLVGQESVSQTLSLALDQQKISNAYLFSGLRGSGKTSSARIFARALQCDKGPTSSPCGECDNCKSALEGKHLDIIEMDAASNRRIDDIRELIEQTKYSPSFGRFKIFIIDEVHMLTKESFNALLKTLEEPPSYVKFILATTDPLLLPATILSRTQHFRFKKIPHKIVVSHIVNILQKEGVGYDQEALEVIARSGSGSLRDTLTLLDQAIIFGKNYVGTTSTTEMLGIIDPEILEKFFLSVLQKQEQTTSEILSQMQEYECEMILDEMMLFLKDVTLKKHPSFPPLILNRFFNILTQSKTLLALNTNGEFVLLLSVLKMQEALKFKEISSLIPLIEKDVLNNSHSIAQPQITQEPLQTTQSPTPQNTPQELFAILITKIYDRSYEIGVMFDKNFKFISFENHQLMLSTSKNESELEILRSKWGSLKEMILSVFGKETKIIMTTQPTQQTPSQETIDSLHKYFGANLASVEKRIHGN